MNAELVVAFKPSLPESEFLKIFPLDFRVSALTMYQAQARGLHTDRTYWIFSYPFEYIDPKWGSIVIPAGFITDFASVPAQLHSIIDDDSPIMLYPSAPHDFLFTPRADGTRGWLPDGTQLSLTDVNHVLTRAMGFCGADELTQDVVFASVELANESMRETFAYS